MALAKGLHSNFVARNVNEQRKNIFDCLVSYIFEQKILQKSCLTQILKGTSKKMLLLEPLFLKIENNHWVNYFFGIYFKILLHTKKFKILKSLHPEQL